MRRLAILLIIAVLTVSNLTVVSSAQSSIPKPSVPEFTLKFTPHSYDEPTTYSIDPYTGDNVTNAGYHSEWTTLDIVITNQAFDSSSCDISGLILMYNVRVKGHYEEDWKELYGPGGVGQDSGSDYTVVSYSIGENGGTLNTGNKAITVYGEVDFQVQAMIGNVVRGQPPFYEWEFAGEESKWSNTQTFTFNSQTSTPSLSATSPLEMSPMPSPEPQQTLQIKPIVATAVIALIIGAALGLLIGRVTKK